MPFNYIWKSQGKQLKAFVVDVELARNWGDLNQIQTKINDEPERFQSVQFKFKRVDDDLNRFESICFCVS